MTLNASKGKISSAKFKTHASDISVEIPVQYPTPKKERIGKYSIPSISYDKQYHLSAKGKIRQRKFLEFLVDGSASFKSLPAMEPIYNLVVGFKNGAYANVDFETNSFNVTHDDIQKLTPQNLQTAQIDITASAKGNAEFINHQLKTKMHVNVNNGNVHIPDMNFTASGINTAIALNDLLVAESIPGQILTIDSIEVNKIKIDDAKVRFSIEDAKSLLIENIQAKWCGGHVSTESIRLSMDKKDYALSLYCDRLEMAQLMEQMEILKSKGTGTLNGRLPISYSDGDISFNNGFLFSTSGSGGKIKIEDTSKIIASAGIPMNDPAFVQIDLAQEALKDFDYKWAKLIFNTFEDELTLNISINGKPTKNLPFEPLASGGFVRVDESSPGSVLEGLQLDVNLNLPFKEMMKFGNKLKSIFN
ncbi:MAG: hypothetical protein GY699_25335 [Desulfobacteraceae bacterium]|nr:hypothetical protein [Desulfobacteraceae bacterium]